MSEDWKEEIKAAFDKHAKRKREVSSTLGQLLDELSSPPYDIECYYELVEEYPLTWKVSLEQLEMHFDEGTLTSFQCQEDGKFGDLKEALKELLLRNYTR